MKEIHVDGVGGLGNCLFQIATAIYYKEKYGYEIIFNDNSRCLQMGTDNRPRNRRTRKWSGENVNYKFTIFNKFTYRALGKHQYQIVRNDTLNDEIIPTAEYLKLDGYCSEGKLYHQVSDKLLSYFNLNDRLVHDYIKSKYNLENQKNIMLGIRIAPDFAHMTKITCESYRKALYTLVSEDETDYNLIILSDTVNWTRKVNFKINGRIIVVDEDDITQFYVGLLCNHFILSESTYHYWMAYFKSLMDKNTQVVVFNNTEVRNLLPEWIKIDLS